MEALRQETKAGMEALRQETRAGIEAVKADLPKWLFDAPIAQGSLIVALVKLLQGAGGAATRRADTRRSGAGTGTTTRSGRRSSRARA